MKLKTFVLFVVFAMLVSFSSCAGASRETRAFGVDLSFSEFQENKHIVNDFEAGIGDTITIKLSSIPLTGYKWEYERIGKVILQETDYEYVGPGGEGVEIGGANEGWAPGGANGEFLESGGREVWTFEAIRKGTTEIRMEYSSLWEGGRQGDWTYTMTVTVE